MEKRFATEPQLPLIPWHKSLPFKLSLIRLLIISLLISSTAWLMLSIQTQQLNEQQGLLNQNHGQIVIAKLQEMTSQIENQVNTISNIAMLYRHNPEQLNNSIPVLLSADNPKLLISGGGIWPEPSAFNQHKLRDSLFWTRDKDGKLRAIDSYNDERTPSYHGEAWYRPTRYFPAGKTFWSPSYIDPTTGEIMVTAAGAMWMDHLFVGAVTADIGLERLNVLLRNVMTDVKGYAIALDYQNQLLASPSNGHNLPDSGTQALQHFDDLAKTQPNYAAVSAALHTADQKFIEQALSTPTFSPTQIADLSQSKPAGESKMLAAIVNDSANKHITRPKLLSSVTLTLDPILKVPAHVSVFLMPNTYWKILVVTPIAPVQDTAKRVVEKAGIYLIIMQAIGLLVLFLLQHRLFITPIMQFVQALKSNDASAIAHQTLKRHDEIGLLAKTFLLRTEQLDTAMTELDASRLTLAQQLQNQQQFQQELSLHREQLKSLLEFSQNIIYIKDLKGKYTLVNDKYCEILGMERQHLIGATDFELFQSQLAQQYQLHDQRVTYNRQAIQFEESIATPRGELIYHMTKFDIKDDEGNSIGVGAIGFDMDERKRQEKQQEKQLHELFVQFKDQHHRAQLVQHEIQHLRKQLATINEEMSLQYKLNLSKQQSQKLMQNFIAEIMSQLMHEQDQLVAQICSALPEARRAPHAQVIDLLTEQAQRLRHISQLCTDQLHNIRPLHLASFTRHLVSLLQPQLSKAQVEVEIHCSEQLLIEGNSWQYLQFFYRLLNNTLHHAFSGRHQNKLLQLQIEKQGNELHIRVTDNGVGLSEQQQRQLQQEMAKNLCNGTLTCLNLWIKNELKGTLALKSELSCGTQIHCHWPI